MFKIELKPARGSFESISRLDRTTILENGAIPGFLQIVCNTQTYGYVPDSEVEESHGDYWLNDWIFYFLVTLERLRLNQYVGISDPECYRNVLDFARCGENVRISHFKYSADHTILDTKPENVESIWTTEVLFEELRESILDVSQKFVSLMLQLNSEFAHSPAWLTLNRLLIQEQKEK